MLLTNKSLLFVCLLTPFAAQAQSTSIITTTSSGNYRGIVAPSSLVSAWGSGFTATTVAANSNPPVSLPTTLGGQTLTITDSANAKLIPSLYLVSPGQINFVVPDTAAVGKGTLLLTPNGANGALLISSVAPSIFTADGSGVGVPAAQIQRVNANNQSTYESPFLSGASTYQPSPIDISVPTDRVFLILYGSGIRNHSLNPVIAIINGVQVPVTYAGLQSTYPGLDQVNLGPMPASLSGSGTVNAIISVDGVPSNAVQVAFK